MQAPRGAAGYSHPSYARSLSQFGAPAELPLSKAWLLKRAIAGGPEHDAMACYPLLCCRNWRCLPADLTARDGLVSFAAVADPFGDYDLDLLRDCFPDVLIPFKQHFVVDLAKPIKSALPSAHIKNTRQAEKKLSVEPCAVPVTHLDEWTRLYQCLIERHEVRGLRTFSRRAFEEQLQVPGMTAFRAVERQSGAIAGMLLWYVQGDVAYYHLGASNHLGYKLMSSYALFSAAIDHFAGHGLRWLNLGGGAGIQQERSDGLALFKQGWATGTRTAWFCGRILDRTAYRRLTESRGSVQTNYFPAYRSGEFI